MAKKQLTIEEKLEAALVPVEEQPYKVPENWCWVYLLAGYAECLDKYRKPVNAKERAERIGEIPYYGATGQVGWIDDYLTDEQLVLLGEDGAPFLDLYKDKAYMIEGKAWVNNHAHILRSFWGRNGNELLVHYLNQFNFNGYVNGTTRLKLTQASMNVIPMVLPPRAEQSRIIARIESLFAKLDEAKEKIQEVLDGADLRRAAILHQAFTGKLTEKWRKENAVSDDSWEENNLQNVCLTKITDGTHKTPKYTTKEEGGVPFISAKDVTKGEICWDNIKYIIPELHEELHARLAPQRNDILLAKNGTTGVAAIVDTDEVFDLYVTLAVLRPNTDIINPRYLLRIVNSPICKRQFDERLKGIGVPNLHLRDIKEVVIKIPSVLEQQEIVRLLDNLLSREQSIVTACEEALTIIDTLKKSILARAFRGELGTNDPTDPSAQELLREILSA